MLVLVDIDGTLSSSEWRVRKYLNHMCKVGMYGECPHRGQRGDAPEYPDCSLVFGCKNSEVTPEQWDSFLDPAEVIKDPAYHKAVIVLEKLAERIPIKYWTGRNKELYETTWAWLKQNGFPIEKNNLYTLSDDGHSSVVKEKERMLKSIMKTEGRDITLIDDAAYVGELSAIYDLRGWLKAPECWNELHEVRMLL